MMRFEEVNTCAECGECDTGDTCDPVRGPLRKYSGIRFTSDGFDCALPVSIDSHSHCSYGCLYCFSDQLVAHRENTNRGVGQTSLASIEAIFSGKPGAKNELYREGLKYHDKVNGYPCPIQLGAICDPCDNIERQQGWLLEFIKLAIKYRQPVRMSTKGTILTRPDYQKALAEAPELFWVAFSIISSDDDVLEAIDCRAPNATKRLDAMKRLSRLGVTTSLRFRPMMPGISDRTAKHPHAYRELIERAADAGAIALSCEVAFTPGGANADIRKKWRVLSDIAGVPLMELYKGFGTNMSCNRPAYGWTEDIMHSVVEVAHQCGMTVGVSDPVWKQLTDTGCCCGILPDDPVFGNWQRQSATNRLLEAKNGRNGGIITLEDTTPPWAHKEKYADMCNPGVGPTAKALCSWSWADKLKQNWNTVGSQRGPLQYFQGALVPVDRVDGDLIYKYVGLKREYQRGRHWHIDKEPALAVL